jgi:PAS domain S-box-containing protein
MSDMKLTIKLPLLIVVTAVIAAFLVGAIQLFVVSKSITTTESEANLNSVSAYASAIGFYLGEARSTIEITAHEEGLAGFTPNAAGTTAPHEINERLRQSLHETAAAILDHSTVFEYVMLLDADGSINTLEPQALGDKLARNDLGYTAWCKSLMSMGKTIISDLHISPATLRPTVVVATPIKDSQGQITGIWAGGLKLDRLSHIGLAQSQPGQPQRYGYVTDSRGLIIAHQGILRHVEDQTDFSSNPPVQAALSGKRGVMKYVSAIDGNEKLGAYMPLPGANWAVVYTVPTRVAFKSMNILAGYLVGLGVLMIVLMGLGALLISRQITRPLEQLAAAAVKMGTGDLSQRVSVASSDEIGQLSAEFNRMAESLQALTIERRRAEEARLTAEASAAAAKVAKEMIEGMTDPVIMSALNGKIVRFNKATSEFWGYGDEIIGKLPTALVVEREAPVVFGVINDALHKGFVKNVEHTALTKDKREVPILLSVVMLRDSEGNPLSMIASTRDISERKQAEQALAEKTEDLQRSNEELERFAYVASHDLQEPLRMVTSYMQLLERRYGAKLDADAHDFIGFAIEGARRMHNLINDLLQLSRVGTHGKPFQDIELSRVFDEALNNLEVAINENGAVITRSSLPAVLVDAGQMVQLFQNLLSNAIKFHGKGPPNIEVSAKKEDSEWIFAVKDNGIGIDPKYFDRIFAVFQRLGGNEYPGTGLGLAQVRKIVQRHRGRIWVESQPGEGSTFYFTIPARGRGDN